jgi:hypothetical protein
MRLMADSKLRCSRTCVRRTPGLETTASRPTPAHFQTVSEPARRRPKKTDVHGVYRHLIVSFVIFIITYIITVSGDRAMIDHGIVQYHL